ncbi:MAG: hypothetical protein R2825_21875 [Saprospiraceae bacterium]
MPRLSGIGWPSTSAPFQQHIYHHEGCGETLFPNVICFSYVALGFTESMLGDGIGSE